RRLDKLAAAWVAGETLDWKRLHRSTVSRVHLPGYPFARERYWKPPPATPAGAWLHPLLHTNTSSLAGVAFRSRFSAADRFIADHHVNGRPVLPAVAYLEMSCAAVSLALGRSASFRRLRLSSIVWAAPLQPSGNG